MTTKPEHTRPFDMEHAKAGAPYCCASGERATILKWDCANQKYPLAGVCEEGDYPESWAADGVQSKGDYPTHEERNLVMLPLGMVEGKPAFVGDKIALPGGSEHTIKPADRPANDCTWPKPTPKYPQTRMSTDELAQAWANNPGIIGVANAAIARAIEDGQVYVAGAPYALNPLIMVPADQLHRAEAMLETAGYRRRDSGAYEFVGGDLVPADMLSQLANNFAEHMALESAKRTPGPGGYPLSDSEIKNIAKGERVRIRTELAKIILAIKAGAA